ncbi:MAG: hypothetical protein LBM70_07065 [Victivallales bacterium]|nr:hypothetical protein [Victivallales bacterium]
MKLFILLSVLTAFVALSGCSLFPTGAELPENAPLLLAYQIGDEPKVLVVPICDYNNSIAIGTPQVMRFRYPEFARLNTKYHSFWQRQIQPTRVLILTPSGTLYSATGFDTPEPDMTFFRAQLNDLGKKSFLSEIENRNFTITSRFSPWLAPGSKTPEREIQVRPFKDDDNISEAVAFISAVKISRKNDLFRPFDRTWKERNRIYCSALKPHLKPNYLPNTILTLDYTKDQPVRIGSKASFSDINELKKVLTIHLASGRYALLKVRLSALEDVFPLDHSGIGTFLQNLAEHYGSDLLIELPDGTNIWHCSRCFSPE